MEKKEYYNQNVVFQNELERVNSLFQNAPNKNISIQKRFNFQKLYLKNFLNLFN